MKKNAVSLGLRMGADLKKRLQEEADSRHISMTTIIILALEEAIKNDWDIVCKKEKGISRGHDEFVGIQITYDLKESLKRYAKKQGKDMTKAVKSSLERYLK